MLHVEYNRKTEIPQPHGQPHEVRCKKCENHVLFDRFSATNVGLLKKMFLLTAQYNSIQHHFGRSLPMPPDYVFGWQLIEPTKWAN